MRNKSKPQDAPGGQQRQEDDEEADQFAPAQTGRFGWTKQAIDKWRRRLNVSQHFANDPNWQPAAGAGAAGAVGAVGARHESRPAAGRPGRTPSRLIRGARMGQAGGSN